MPHFEVMDQSGNMVSSESFIGKKTIIYFYPKDNTSGCTAEACSLRDNYDALVAAGYNVVGVSKDSAASHTKFIQKHSLPFTLLADTTTEMQQVCSVCAVPLVKIKLLTQAAAVIVVHPPRKATVSIS